MRSLRRVAVLALTCAGLLTVHMLLLGASAPVVRTMRVAIPGWPAGAGDLRIAFLSDAHPSTPGDTPDRLKRTAAAVTALHPDLILIGGDLVADLYAARTYSPEASVAPLAGLAAPLGTFAVLGNHDWARDPDRIARALDRLGIVQLENRALRVGPLAVIGVGDDYSHHADVPLAMRRWQAIGGVPIVFTHSPDVMPRLPAGLPLAFAGHTHCGQFRLPLIGPLTTKSRYGDRYGCGVVRENGRTTIVSAGLGMSGLPVRLGLPPDLWLVTVGR